MYKPPAKMTKDFHPIIMTRDSRSFTLKAKLRKERPVSDAPAWEWAMYNDLQKLYSETHARKATK